MSLNAYFQLTARETEAQSFVLVYETQPEKSKT